MEQMDLFSNIPKPVEGESSISAPDQGSHKGKMYLIDTNRLSTDPDQPRKFFDPQPLSELQASILKHGILQPILVRKIKKGNFCIVSGERRFQAAKNVGLEKIPAIITDGEPAELSIIENLLRENLTAIEEAEALERLRTKNNYGLTDLCAVLGKAESTISEILSLNRLPQEVKDDCRNNPKAVRSILKVIARQKSPDKMIAQYRKYRDSGLVCAEILPKITKRKTDRAQIRPSDIAAIAERIEMLSTMQLTNEQKDSMVFELTKLRAVAFQKIRLLKVE